MKKLFTVLFVSVSLFSYAQSFQLTDADGNVYTDGETISATITEADLDLFKEYITDIFVMNLTDAELEIRTFRTNIALPEGMNAYVCFGICDSPEGTTFGMDWTLFEGAKESYALHLRPNGNFGLCKFQIDFMTSGESMTLYLEIDMQFVGIKDPSSNATVSLSASPNPAQANSTLNVSYTLADNYNNYRLSIRNILGVVVLDVPLNPDNNLTAIDISGIKSGVYFYSIETNNRISVAKKLIVK